MAQAQSDPQNRETAEADRMAQLTRDDLVVRQSLEPGQITIVNVAASRWRTPTFDCPEPPRIPGAAEIPGYLVILVASDSVFTYHTDAVSSVRLCKEEPIDAVEPETLLIIDPVAAEMLALVRRALGADLDLPTRRIQLVDIAPIVWPDSSLGCPVDGQSYEEFTIDGYRIVVAAGGSEYIYHSDFDSIVSCEPENEVLP